MRYSIEIKRFVLSQNFFSGLRIAFGLALPPIILLLGFGDQELGFTIASGAIAASVVDLPGPLKYKHNEMLACSGLAFVAALIAGLASANPLSLWLTVVLLTFPVSLLVVCGAKGPQISFATLYAMVICLEAHFTPWQALVNAAWLLAGSLWYTYWSFFVSRWQTERIERQAIADAIFSAADYLHARARFYDLSTDVEDNYRNLITQQIAAIERQDAARDVVLRNLPRNRRAAADRERRVLFNLFLNCVDLHDTIVGSHTDYALLRNTFGESDLMQFFHDLVDRAARDLQAIGLKVLQKRPLPARIPARAELRAIEHEIERMRRRDFPARDSDAYATVVSTYRRVWSLTRAIDRMHRQLTQHAMAQPQDIVMDQRLPEFLVSRRFTARQILSNLTPSSPGFRHALRMTLAVALALAVGKALPSVTNSYWIVLTTIVILKPGFSLTRQRNAQRLAGTVIGCAASVGFLMFVHEPPLILLVMLGCMVMAYSLLLINYAAAVVFISAYVLLLYHLMAPVGMRLIGERALDTLLGSAIAVAASYLYANWEYRLMAPLVQAMLTRLCEYVGALRTLAASARRAATPSAAATIALNAPAQTPKAAHVATGATSTALLNTPESDYRFRLARKNAHIAFLNLGQAFTRMMREPKSKQRYVSQLNILLLQSQALLSYVTAAAPLFASLEISDGDAFDDALRAVSAHLEQAEKPLEDNRDAEPSEAQSKAQAALANQEMRELTRRLDALVIQREEQLGTHAEAAQEFKLLALQCKQMLGAAQLIAHNVRQIRLTGDA